MKKWLYICLVFQLFCIGCFEDESSLEIRSLNPIRIENISLSGTYSLYMGDTLRVEPLVFCEGVPDAEMDFEWKLSGGTMVPTVLDSTMYLCTKIAVPPTRQPYTLKFTITDKTTGIARIETFSINILSPYGEGIIVADTRDGQTTDLSLVMSREFSADIPKEDSRIRIFRNIWSQNNGAPLAGKVLDCTTSDYGGNRSMTILTTEHILRADYYDFVNIPEEADGGMFHAVPPHIGHGYTHGQFALHPSQGNEIMSANGQITIRSQQNMERKYSYTSYPTGLDTCNVTLMYNVRLQSLVYCYDALGKQMLFCTDICKKPLEQSTASKSKFDVSDLSDYEPFLMREMSSGVTLLAKQKSTGAYKGLVMKHSTSMSEKDFAKSVFDFSSATEIDQAKFFDLNRLEEVIYYATETKLYTTPIQNINSMVQWEVPVGSADKITGIKVYNWGGGTRMHEATNDQGRKQEAFEPSSHKMIMIYTYNETTQEGKVVCVPIETIGLGGLETNKAFHVTLSGFNRIVGVYKQNK